MNHCCCEFVFLFSFSNRRAKSPIDRPTQRAACVVADRARVADDPHETPDSRTTQTSDDRDPSDLFLIVEKKKPTNERLARAQDLAELLTAYPSITEGLQVVVTRSTIQTAGC